MQAPPPNHSIAAVTCLLPAQKPSAHHCFQASACCCQLSTRPCSCGKHCSRACSPVQPCSGSHSSCCGLGLSWLLLLAPCWQARVVTGPLIRQDHSISGMLSVGWWRRMDVHRRKLNSRLCSSKRPLHDTHTHTHTHTTGSMHVRLPGLRLAHRTHSFASETMMHI
jgi:hypothetical protein